MDNLKAHKVEGVEKMIEAVGAKVVYLSCRAFKLYIEGGRDAHPTRL
ncbi:hypothetical protein [Phormidium nigroviride]|nr:hypothetical protein [Oscillatoria nigro-viridis]